MPDKSRFEIRFPVLIRVERTLHTHLDLDWSGLRPLTLDPSRAPTEADLARTLEGGMDEAELEQLVLDELAKRRIQQQAFLIAAQFYDKMQPAWPGRRELLCAQLVNLVDRFLRSDLIRMDGLWNQTPKRRRTLMVLNMTRIINHLWRHIEASGTERLEPVFDRERPIRSTGDMATWFTGKPYGPARKSHINFCVYDSEFEATVARSLDSSPEVEAWVKNDHLGFEVSYVHRGVVRTYIPDFLIRLNSGRTLVLEVKGAPTERDDSKWAYLDHWVEAVNTHGGFGSWSRDVLLPDSDLVALLYRHNM